MLEAVDQLGLEGEPNEPLYQMLLGALRALAGHRGPLVVPAFFLKVLALEGFRPVVDACVECGDGRTTSSASTSSRAATRCREHRRGTGGLARGARAPQRHPRRPARRGAQRRARPTATTEVDHLAVRAVEHHLERRLRSIAVLDHG